MAFLLLGGAPARAEDEPFEGPPVETHDFLSQGFVKTTANDYLAESERGSFEFSEVGIHFPRASSEPLSVGFQPFVRALGPIGNYQPRFDRYYLDYRSWDWLGLRAGRTKPKLEGHYVHATSGLQAELFDSEQSVVRYVLEHSGAVGHAAPSIDLDGAKAIAVRWG